MFWTFSFQQRLYEGLFFFFLYYPFIFFFKLSVFALIKDQIEEVHGVAADQENNQEGDTHEEHDRGVAQGGICILLEIVGFDENHLYQQVDIEGAEKRGAKKSVQKHKAAV